MKLVVRKDNSKDSLIKFKYITVNNYLKADFDADITSGDYPLTIQFNNKSKGDIISYTWDFGDGKTDTIKNPVNKYIDPGMFTVKLIVFDGTYTDSIEYKDIINVNRKAISDSNFSMETIIPLQYIDIIGTTAFDADNGFFAEGFDKKNTTLFRLNNLLEPESNRVFYTNKFHKQMKKSCDGIYYFVGDTVYNNVTVQINQFDNIDNFKNFYKLQLSNNSNIFDFLATSTNFYVCYNSINFYDYLQTKCFSNDGTLIWNIFKEFYLGDTDKVVSLKLSKFIDNKILYAYSEKNHRIDVDDWQHGKQWFYNLIIYSYDNDNPNDDNMLYNSITQIIPFDDISDIDYNSSRLLLLLKNNTVYSAKSGFTPFFSDSNTIITSIKIISPYKALLTGSKSGYCWYSFLDSLGNIKEEHTILERPGCFYTSNVNADNSLLFSGVLNKNYTEKYLYLYKTNIMNDSIEKVDELIQNDKITLYPNPANDEIIIKGNNLKFDNIRLFNCYGETISLPEKIFPDSDKIRINLNTLSSGMYFVRIQTGRESIIEKFTVIK